MYRHTLKLATSLSRLMPFTLYRNTDAHITQAFLALGLPVSFIIHDCFKAKENERKLPLVCMDTFTACKDKLYFRKAVLPFTFLFRETPFFLERRRKFVIAPMLQCLLKVLQVRSP